MFIKTKTLLKKTFNRYANFTNKQETDLYDPIFWNEMCKRLSKSRNERNRERNEIYIRRELEGEIDSSYETYFKIIS